MSTSSENSRGLERTGLRLIGLREACERIGISVRSYYLHPDCLPVPTRVLNKLMFAEHEVDALICEMLEQRQVSAGGAPPQVDQGAA